MLYWIYECVIYEIQAPIHLYFNVRIIADNDGKRDHRRLLPTPHKNNGHARRLKNIGHPVYLRFAHEMNGNWYPWSGTKIGKEKYVAVYRHVKNVFRDLGAGNVRWVFSVNAEDVPPENNYFMRYYPGNGYVDYLGVDGYNWGNTRSWSRWRSFREIFEACYMEITGNTDKPVLISEFGSTSRGGDKTVWIKEAMNDIRRWEKIKAFVLFNVDKETDWSFYGPGAYRLELRNRLQDKYFTAEEAGGFRK